MANEYLDHKKKWMPAMYVVYFGLLENICKKHGYALSVHGSVVRDFDIIAIPFEPIVSTHEDVLNEIKEMVGLQISEITGYRIVGVEPHGRMCYAIECGAGGYFDISFTPSMQQAIEYIKSEKRRKTELQKLLKKTRIM